jgi:hypothetical protein
MKGHDMIRTLAAGALAFTLAGCGGDAPPANATAANSVAELEAAPSAAPAGSTPAPSQDAQPVAATLPGVADDALPGKELPAEQFHGRWTVERAAADATAPAGFVPDGAWIGRTLQFDEDAVAWLSKDGAIETATQCENPTQSVVWTAANVRRLAQPFRPAWSALGIPLDQVGTAHHWECDTAEPTSFGPGEGIFFPVGKDQLVLNWKDHAILLLRRAG